MNNKDKQILTDIEKRLKTVMIGGLSRFEDSFGYLWNIDHEPQTKEEKIMRDLWEDTRTDLLNHGNNQIRAALEDLMNFIAYKNKFSNSYKFVFKNNEDNNTNNENRR